MIELLWFIWFIQSRRIRKRDKKRAMSEKPERILKAAGELFGRYGFRRTSMDLVATEAGVAKPTIYSHFADKEALFRAVIAALCDSMYDGAKTASEAAGTLEDRVAAMLSAKHTRFWEIVRGSPHGEELVRSKDELGEAITKRFDRAYAKLLADVLAGGNLRLARFDLTPATCAQLLIRASSGASYDATTAAAHRQHVKEIASVILAALR